MTFTSQTIFPDYNQPSYFDASGLSSNLTQLFSLPTSGTNSPAWFVKDGASVPTLGTYWTNDAQHSGDTNDQFITINRWFQLSFGALLISPSGIVNCRMRVSRNDGNGNDQIATATLPLYLYLYKSLNPSLASDVLMASGVFGSNGIGIGTTGISVNLSVLDINRSTFEVAMPGAIPTLSGTWRSSNSTTAGTSGTRFIYDMDILVSGNTVFSNINNINLYTAGPIQVSGGVPLYTFNSAANSGNINLFVSGVTPTLSSGSMNLFTRGPDTTSGTATIPLSIFSTTNSGQFSTLPLVVGYQKGTPDPAYSLNLYTSGPPFSSANGEMNLFLENNTRTTNSIDLFIQNNYTSIGSGLNLFAAAPSGTYGAVPISGSMNLFVARDSEAIANGVPLYLKTNEGINGGISVYISGANAYNNSINLFMPVIDSGVVGTTKLYTRGY